MKVVWRNHIDTEHLGAHEAWERPGGTRAPGEARDLIVPAGSWSLSWGPLVSSTLTL